MSEKPKSTFARRVRAAKPRAKKYEIRDDVFTGLGRAPTTTTGNRARRPDPKLLIRIRHL